MTDETEVMAALAAAAAAKRAWLAEAVQTGEPAVRHAAADVYERAHRAALRAADEWIDANV